jgi:hypothetical protein
VRISSSRVLWILPFWNSCLSMGMSVFPVICRCFETLVFRSVAQLFQCSPLFSSQVAIRGHRSRDGESLLDFPFYCSLQAVR